MNNLFIYFKMFLNYLYHGWEVIGNELYKHFSSYMYMCVDVVNIFAMDLIIMIYHKKYKPFNFLLVCTPYISAFYIHKS